MKFDEKQLTKFFKEKSNDELIEFIRKWRLNTASNNELDYHFCKKEIVERMESGWISISLTREQVENLFNNIKFLKEDDTTIPLMACYVKFGEPLETKEKKGIKLVLDHYDGMSGITLTFDTFNSKEELFADKIRRFPTLRMEDIYTIDEWFEIYRGNK